MFKNIFDRWSYQMTNLSQEQYIQELEHRIRVLEEELKKINARGKPGRKKKVNEKTEREIQQLYCFGASMDSLSKKFNYSKGTIFNIIHAD